MLAVPGRFRFTAVTSLLGAGPPTRQTACTRSLCRPIQSPSTCATKSASRKAGALQTAGKIAGCRSLQRAEDDGRLHEDSLAGEDTPVPCRSRWDSTLEVRDPLPFGAVRWEGVLLSLERWWSAVDRVLVVPRVHLCEWSESLSFGSAPSSCSALEFRLGALASVVLLAPQLETRKRIRAEGISTSE